MAKAPLDFPPMGLVGVLLAQVNKLQADVAALRASLNQHTHIENTAGTYTQNATTGAGPTLAALTSEQITTL